MTFHKKACIILFMVILLISLCQQIPAAKVGVVPANISMKDVLKDTIYHKSIRIYNNGDEPISYELNASKNMKSWVTFFKSGDLTKPITEITVHDKEIVIVEFLIPSNVANGEYTGTINVTTNPSGETKNDTSSKVLINFPVQVSLTTTGEQILTGNVTSLKVKDTEVGQQVLFTCGFINTGNVIATPTIDISITRKGGFPIDNFTYAKTSVDLDSGKEIIVPWDTTDREPGMYQASVSVFLDDKRLTQQNFTFELLPRGTLTREGELIEVTCSKNPTVGKFMMINATFKNTGRIETAAQCFLEIHRNDELVDIVKSEDEPIVDVNDEYLFSIYYKLEQGGHYDIDAYVQYENNKTAITTVSFDAGGLFENAFVIGLILVGIISGGILYYLFVSKVKIKVKRKPFSSSPDKKPVRVSNEHQPSLLDNLRTGQLIANQLQNAQVLSSKMTTNPTGELTMVNGSKDDIIQQFISFDGIDENKATMLYENGITSLEELKKQSINDLTTTMDIDRKTAVLLRKQIKQSDLPSKKISDNKP